MKINKKITILIILLFLILSGYIQGFLFSPLTPKASAIAHFKINPKMIPKTKTAQGETPLTEDQIKEKHGRLELIRFINNSSIRGVVIEQGEDFIKVETSSGVRKIFTDQIDTVEIIR